MLHANTAAAAVPAAYSDADFSAPLKKFTLADFGIPPARLIERIKPAYEWLEWDYYDVRREQIALLSVSLGETTPLHNRAFYDYYEFGHMSEEIFRMVRELPAILQAEFHCIRPYRRRSVSRFRTVYSPLGAWRVEEIPLRAVSQRVARSDYRSIPRKFHSMDPELGSLYEFRELLRGVSELVREAEPNAGTLEITCWQTGIVASASRAASNSPEGIHQDGADYIVSALVVERTNIGGGESIVYGPDKTTEILRTTLAPGEGIFQADSGSPLWHTVTPIRVQTPSSPGIRNILGFDIMVIED